MKPSLPACDESNKSVKNRIERAASIIIAWLCIVILYSPVSFAGDFGIELADAAGPVPGGDYIDQMEDTAFSKNLRYSLKYTFDSGWLLGWEEFGSGTYVDDGSDESYLFINIRGFSLGYAIGDVLRLSAELGIPLGATISLKENQTGYLGGETKESQQVSSRWYGLGLDWGAWEKDGSGVGITLTLRQVALTESDLFDTGLDFDGSGLYWGVGLRYRFQ